MRQRVFGKHFVIFKNHMCPPLNVVCQIFQDSCFRVKRMNLIILYAKLPTKNVFRKEKTVFGQPLISASPQPFLIPIFQIYFCLDGMR